MRETGGLPRVCIHFSLRLEVSKTTVDSHQESVGVLRTPMKRGCWLGLVPRGIPLHGLDCDTCPSNGVGCVVRLVLTGVYAAVCFVLVDSLSALSSWLPVRRGRHFRGLLSVLDPCPLPRIRCRKEAATPRRTNFFMGALASFTFEGKLYL